MCDYFLERGDYVKLDNVTLGYTFNIPNCKFIDNVKISCTGRNLLTITKFSGIDPDNYQVNGLNPCATGSRSYYPSTRQFIFSVNVGF